MALPLPRGRHIQIYHRRMEGNYEMPSMEVAQDHYSLGFMIHGDRRIITPTATYDLHEGYVSALAPYIYHRTVPGSNEYYENTLLKFSPSFVSDFDEKLGGRILEQIYEFPVKRFDEKTRTQIFDLAGHMLDIYENKDYKKNYTEFRLKNLLYEMLLLIHENGKRDDENITSHNLSLTKEIMEAVYFMEKNYMNPISIKDAADAAGYSVSYFSRLFAAQLGIPFSEYLQAVRLNHVKQELLKTDRSIVDIALDNGFIYPGNMSSVFRKRFGMTPIQFRQKKN